MLGALPSQCHRFRFQKSRRESRLVMLKLRSSFNRAPSLTREILSSWGRGFLKDGDNFFSADSIYPLQTTSVRFIGIHQLGNKEAIEKERARLADEMSRGYFADMSDLKKHGGKIAMANKTVIPAAVAVKFPAVEVNYTDGRSMKLPVGSEGNVGDPCKTDAPKVTLLGLSFRASSQPMIDSWSRPFIDVFRDSRNVQIYEVSFIESWLLSLNPVKGLLLRLMKKSNPVDRTDALQRDVVYSFGDHYYFRKELKILNLLTGYMFLLDKFGRIRWQGFGMATEEELSFLLSCTSLLTEEK